MRIVGVDVEGELEDAALVDACAVSRIPKQTPPSSGVIVRVKFRMSSLSAQSICIVSGSSSSVMSAVSDEIEGGDDQDDPYHLSSYPPFCTRNWAAEVFGFFLFAASWSFLSDQICVQKSSRARVGWRDGFSTFAIIRVARRFQTSKHRRSGTCAPDSVSARVPCNGQAERTLIMMSKCLVRC